MKKFTARLTDDESELLGLEAKKLGRSKNDIIRYLINNKILEISNEMEVYKELSDNYKKYAFQLQKIGTVLNQINKNFNSKIDIDIDELEKELDELWQFIKVLKE